MVKEYRRINLNKDELIDALEAHNRMAPNFLPAGKIFSLQTIGHDSVEIRLAVNADDYRLTANMVMSENHLLMPVIRYCIESNVWLPPQGRKSVEIMDEGVALCVAVDTDTDFGSGEPLRLSRYAHPNECASVMAH